MSATLEILEVEFLQLPALERSHLLERLIASLDVDPETEAAWDQEANRREANLASGCAEVVSAQEALSRLKARLAN